MKKFIDKRKARMKELPKDYKVDFDEEYLNICILHG